VALCERSVQAVDAAVRVAVELRSGARDRLLRSREGPERALVGRELDHAREPELALNILNRLARLIGRQPTDAGPKERIGEVGEPTAHGAGPYRRAVAP